MDPKETNENAAHAPDLSVEKMKMPENSPAAKSVTPNESKPLYGLVLFLLTVILITLLGGMYYWFSQLTTEIEPAAAVERPTDEQNNEPESTTAEAAVETQGALSTSDEIAAIEADIEATDLDALDAELNAIDAELEASMNE